MIRISSINETILVLYSFENMPTDFFNTSMTSSFSASCLRSYTRILNRIKELGKQPVILSLPPIDSERFFERVSEGLNKENILKFLDGNKRHISEWHERYNLETFKITAANNVPIIDITSKFLECSNYSDYLCDDGIHPNEKGHRLIADTIREYIKEKRSGFKAALGHYWQYSYNS